MSLELRACREVAVLAGLVIASIVPCAKAKTLPPKLQTYGAAREELSDSSPKSPIHTSNGDMHTRIVIDVGSEVKYRSARISEPDRIYFDIEGAQLTSAMVQKPIDVGDGSLLKGIRTALRRDGILRVVLDVNQVKDYSASLLPDPYRLVVDLYGASAAIKADAHNVVLPAGPAATYLPSVQTDKTGEGTVAAAPPKSIDTSAVKSPLVPSANTLAAESRSLPAFVSSTALSNRMDMKPPGETGSNPARDSEKYFAVASPPSTAQEGEVAASAPPRPVAGEQRAAKPAKVTYVDGQLTIIAENSLLSDILSALHTAMGAEIDLPASASSERMWVRLGPGPARKVLGELLSGTDLNFVIQGSATDAEGIRSVLLTPHSEAGPRISSEPQERMANRQPPVGNPTAVKAAEAPEQENPAPAETTTASSDPTPPDAGSPRLAPQSEAASVSSAAENTMAHPSPPSSMTSEEIRQQLLSMYQQRRQLQQNQPSTPANPHP
jgi:hypothetical protein